MDEESRLSKSEIVTVGELINKIRNSEWSLWLPSFQRSYVWESEDIKMLFESLVRRYPVGILMFWAPERREVADPFSIPITPPFAHEPRGEKILIVDGQQRLVSLLLAASGWRLKIGPYIVEREPVSLNIARLQFEVGRKGVDVSPMIRVVLGWSTGEEKRLQEKLGMDGYNKLKNIVEQLLKYELPYYVLRTENEDGSTLKRMAEIFILANRAGQRISNVELMLSYAAGALVPRASNIIRDWYDDLQRKCRVLDIQPVIRFGFGVGLELRQKDIDQVDRFKSAVEKLAGQVDVYGKPLLESRLSDSLRYFDVALDLCAELFGKAAPELLPSQISLIPIAAFLKTKGVKDLDMLESDDRGNIREWLLLVNFHGYYSTSTSTRLQRDIDVITNLEASDHFPIHDMRRNIAKVRGGASVISKQHVERGLYSDLTKRAGKPYLFLLYTALCLKESSDWTGVRISSLTADKLHRHHIFPYHLFKKVTLMDEEADLVTGLGNITLINPRVNEEIQARHPREYLGERSEDDLESHFIPAESDLWELERFEEFCERRVDMLYAFLSGKMSTIFERTT